MPQSTYDRVAELHNLAAHARNAAATAHGKGDHLTAHELSKQAHEHSTNAYQLGHTHRSRAGGASIMSEYLARLRSLLSRRPHGELDEET